MDGNIFGVDNYGAFFNTSFAAQVGVVAEIGAQSGELLEPIGLQVQVITDATVINRTVRMRFFDSGFPDYLDLTVDYLQQASETINYVFARNIEEKVVVNGTDIWVHTPMPFFNVRAGMRWQLGLFNIQAGDILRNVEFTYQRRKSRF